MGTRSVRKLGGVGYMRGPCCYQAMSKLIMVKSMVGIILCLCVLCNYTEVYNIQCTMMCSICDYNLRFINLLQLLAVSYCFT